MIKKVVKIASICFVVGVIGVIGSYMLNGDEIFSNDESMSVDEKATLSSRIDSLDLNVPLADVTFKETDEKEITIHLHGNFGKKENMKINVNENKNNAVVSVKGSKSDSSIFHFNGWNFTNESRNVDVYVPKEVLKNLNVRMDLGDLSVRDLNIPNIEATNGVGSMDFQNIKTNKLITSSNLGEITLTNIDGDIETKTDTGSIEIDQEFLNGNITATNNLGDIDIKLAKNVKDITFDLKTQVGDLVMDIEHLNKSKKEFGTASSVIGKGTYKVKASSDVGDVSVYH